ncbi:MAG: HAMP domain-containing sensor histidine kinase [Pseudomonadota bacterium]
MRNERRPKACGIGLRIFTAFFAVNLFALTSAFVGWFGLGTIRQAQIEVLESLYPLQNTAHAIALETNHLIVRFPILLGDNLSENLDRDAESVRQGKERLKGLLDDLEEGGENALLVGELRSKLDVLTARTQEALNVALGIAALKQAVADAAEVIEANLSTIIDLTNERQAARIDVALNDAGALRAALDGHSPLLPETAVTNFNAFFGNTLNEVQKATEIKFRADTMLRSIDRISAANDSGSLESLRQLSTSSFRVITEAIARMENGPDRSAFSLPIDKIADQLVGPNNIFDRQKRLIEAIETLAKNWRELVPVSREIEAITSTFSDKITGLTKAQSNATAVATRDTQYALLGFALFASFMSAVIFLLYVQRNIVFRLKRLLSSVTELLKGNLAKPVDRTGDDEITDLEKAIEQFRLNRIQLRETETRLNAYAADLERSNEDLGQFAYVASHDLRAPLRGVTSIAGWIEEDIAEKKYEDVSSNLALLKGRIARMDTLLSSILAYARAGREVEEPVVLDFAQTAREVFGDVNTADRFRLLVSANPGSIEIEPSFLRQLFMNLINNATKHHDKDTGTIEVTYQEDTTHSYLSVSDDGPGIPPEMREKVLKIFQTLKPNDEGNVSGIGLSIVKRLVDRKRGTLRIKDAASGGTEFLIRWPRLQEDADC